MMARIWKRQDIPGHEVCRLRPDAHEMEGTAVMLYDGQACALDYTIRCDEDWHTLDAVVSGWVGDRRIDVRVIADPHGEWLLNGVAQPAVSGAVDADLNFSPSTNTLPIRRLRLPIGDSAQVSAAWLRFPSFELQPLQQRYIRTGERTWRYESANGSFVADLDVDEHGLVVKYGDVWIAAEPS